MVGVSLTGLRIREMFLHMHLFALKGAMCKTFTLSLCRLDNYDDKIEIFK